MYALRGDPLWPDVCFSPKGHSVLDLGAHIGVFSRYALQEGCARLLAVEPEPSNAALLRRNTRPVGSNDDAAHGDSDDDASSFDVRVLEAAVAHGAKASGDERLALVHGRDRNDGTGNTWRHALAGHSHYKQQQQSQKKQQRRRAQGGDEGRGGSGGRGGGESSELEESMVVVLPFFGEGGALQLAEAGGRAAATFVKLDVEGSELALLGSAEAADPKQWRGVTRLVAEWSFTKQRSVGAFHAAVANLEQAGFLVFYDGKGSWWDQRQQNDDGGSSEDREWPWHTDLLLFAARREADVCHN